MSIPFGKYKDKSIEWVYKNDRDYFKWLEGIPLKEPFASEFTYFHLKLAERAKENENIHTNKALFLIDKFIEDNKPIYGVNVHSVGFEFRFNGISLENIMDKQYTLHYNDDGKYININLNKENYQILYDEMEKYWVKKGKPWQDRGLY